MSCLPKKPKIAVVVPTIREENYRDWSEAWESLFEKHEAHLFTVYDGDWKDQEVRWRDCGVKYLRTCMWTRRDLVNPGWPHDFICHRNSSCRNLGFLAAATVDREYDVILTLDDDVFPLEGTDPIQEHIDALDRRVPISWFATVTPYMRGFPYGVREEAPVMVSHGVWEDVPDLDAPTQLVLGKVRPSFYCGPVPKGIYSPICGMNLAFRREALPYVYFAPVAHVDGCQRFDDIWMGLFLTRACAEKNWAIYSGAAVCRHARASNVWKNLQREAVGLELNEKLWQCTDIQDWELHPFFKSYHRYRLLWKEHIERIQAS